MSLQIQLLAAVQSGTLISCACMYIQIENIGPEEISRDVGCLFAEGPWIGTYFPTSLSSLPPLMLNSPRAYHLPRPLWCGEPRH